MRTLTKNETILFNLLTQKGWQVKDVWFEATFGMYSFGGWYAEMQNGKEYKLGMNYQEAKANVEQLKIQIQET